MQFSTKNESIDISKTPKKTETSTPQKTGETMDPDLRYARPGDVDQIFNLLEPFEKQGILLNKDRKKIEADLPRTVVYTKNGQVIGVANLYCYDPNLYEIRGLAIDTNFQKTGIGKKIIEKLLADLKSEFANQTITVFALTLTPGFFAKLGWTTVKKEKFPRKIFDDCAYCLKKDECFEEAVEIVLN